MSTRPRVTVVMCAYNGMGVIEQAVGDILAQQFDDWELVISDDGSDDGTRSYLAGLADSRVRVILQENNLGYVRNKNAAIAAANGEMITQQDQDDRCPPARLSLMVKALDRTGHSIVGCGYRKLDSAGKLQFQTLLACETLITSYKFGEAYPFWFPALLARREVYEQVGLFDEYFAGAFGDDLYWTVKVNERFPILCIPDRLYDYVESYGSITSVAGTDRKLIVGSLLNRLLDQRCKTGTDDLEAGRVDALEQELLADKNLLACRLQVYAARAIDQARFAEARMLLRRAFWLTPARAALAQTILYYCRARLRAWRFPLDNNRNSA
jgi:glycosyltransferase involved in cell wall biosynthesis